MKLSLIFIFSAMLATAANSYGQEGKISLSLKNTNIEQVLKNITAQTGYEFIYNNDAFDAELKVDIDVKQADIQNVLTQLLDEQYSYKIEDKFIVIFPASSTSELASITVTGKVTDSDGKPLPGATVLIKGTFKGIITDQEGKYKISEVTPETILVFSYIGFAKQEITVGNKTTINVTLEQSATELEEVTINAGYYTVKQKEATGNITKVAAKAIEQQPVTNPLQALQGRTPGVFISQRTGLPGSGFDIEIRGRNSIRNWSNNDGNLPLYIIDGVPYVSESLSTNQFGSMISRSSPLNNINPSDIESIEILKDADATAIYGSRGANGVVLITTKKARASQTSLEINHWMGIEQVPRKMELLNTEQYLEMRLEAFKNDGQTPDPNNPQHLDVLEWGSRYTDWQEEFIGGTANLSNTNIVISGGNENTRFSLGGTLYRTTTVFPGDFSYLRGSGRFNLNHTSHNKKFNIDFTSFYNTGRNELPNGDLTRAALTRVPNAPSLLNEDGSLKWDDPIGGNPLATLRRQYLVKTSNFNTNLRLSWQFTPKLKLSTSLGYNRLQQSELRTRPISANNPAWGNTTGEADFTEGLNYLWIIEPQLKYTTQLGPGRLGVIIGGTFQENINELETTRARGFQDDNSLENIAAAGETSILEYRYTQYRYSAIYGRINYKLDDKYILNLTGRRDGSSKFGSDKKFGNFGAIGAAWIFSKEEFFKENSILSFGKLRSSYGIIGSDQIPDYQYLSSYRYTGDSYQGTPSLLPNRIANPEFSWESTRQLEVGLELGFFDDRINTSASYFRKRTSNQLVGFDLPDITGFSSFQFNMPATVENKGWEFLLSTTNIRTKDFRWTSSLNLSALRNKLIEYPNIESSPYANRYRIGKSLYIRGFYDTSVDPEIGMYTFEDLNGDGRVTYADDRRFYDFRKDYFGGFRNNLRYKNIELDFLFRFVKQKGQSYFTYFGPQGFPGNQPTAVLDRWQQAGDVSDIQQFTQGFTSALWKWFDAFYNSDEIIINASFIRLENVSLAYNFPAQLLKQINVKQLRIYLQVQNLFTITNFKGLDPETWYMSLPRLRSITAGIQLKF